MSNKNTYSTWRQWLLTLGVSVVVLGSGWTASGQTGGEVSQGGTTSSQEATSQTSGSAAQLPPSFVSLSGFSNDYRVGAGDLLEIQVVAHTDLNQSLRVSSSGEISFPMAGLISVSDLTVFEVESAVAARLQEKGLLNQPEVLVSVTEYQAKPIYVSGAVISPGQFIMSQDLTVMDAILLAGGLQFNASNQGLVHRRVGEGVQVIKVDLQPLKEGRFLEDALQLQTGDVLDVPREDLHPFYVVGEVIEPRNYFFQPGRTITASQAISWAQGPSPTAKLSDGMLVRYDDQGNRKEIKVDFAEILRGRQPDVLIQPNDIIFIPGSKVKSFTHSFILLTDTMMMQQSFRIGRRMQLPEAPVRDVER